MKRKKISIEEQLILEMMDDRVPSSHIINKILFAGDLNGYDRDGCTYLINAATCGRAEIVYSLIRNGADVNAKNKFGNTLFYA